MAEADLSTRRIIKQGLLMKRCRWSWRPRFIEIISDPPDFSGPLYSFFLLIFDQSHRNVKKRIRIQDIVTIRSGKRYTFQIYLNSGMFLLFRTESMEAQAAWMAELKMALGRGNIFHVQVNTPADNFALDHTLLYCIGVNLPNHRVGQIDRVLVVSSAINDVNLHAWNLSRVKRFMIIEAGIQMELCGKCMGHRKKTVTFLISPESIQDCVDFLVKEARLPSEPKQMATDGPLYYSFPHSCSSVVAESPNATTCPTYTNAEMIVLGKNSQNLSASTGLYINYDGRGRSFSASTSMTQPTSQGSGDIGNKSNTNPLLPPRNIMREGGTGGQTAAGTVVDPSSQSTTTTTTTMTTTHHFDHKPYQINHRIYVNENGGRREDPHVFGSGTWEHNGRKGHSFRPPVIPPRAEDPKPVYVGDNDLHTPATPLQPPADFVRPEFIGRNPPCLPPRDTDSTSSPLLSHRSTSDSNLLSTDRTSGYSPDPMRRNSEHPTHRELFGDHESLTQPVDSNTEKQMYQNIPNIQGFSDWPRSYSSASDRPLREGPTYVNQRIVRSPSPQMCTDDISNADFALLTRVSFSGGILPPRSQQRQQQPRRPIPVPRSRTRPEQTPTALITTTIEAAGIINLTKEQTLPTLEQQTTPPPSNKDVTNETKDNKSEEEKNDRGKEKDACNNPMYFNVGAGRQNRHVLNTSTSTSHTCEVRCISFSSSSLDSDDYKRHSKSKVAVVQKQYSHEI